MTAKEQAILVTLVLYKLLLLGIGLLAQRRTKDAADLYLGGRQLGPLVAAISASASSSSVWTLLGVSGAAYKFGLSALWLFPACVGGFALNWFVVAPRLRRLSAASGALTLTDVLAEDANGQRSRAVRIVASVIILASLVIYVAAQFSGAGKNFATTFEGMREAPAILLGGGIVIVYTMLGGFWAVSLTDTLQGLVMAATAVILPTAALIEVGGFSGLIDGLQALGANEESSYLSMTKGLPAIAGIGLVLGYLSIGLGYPGQPHVVNRFMALSDDRSVARARNYSMIWAVLVYAGMLLLGLCGKLIVAVSDNESIFMIATDRLFPPVITGVMLAAVLSAIMSTADSQLLVAASSVSHDLGAASGNRATKLFGDRVVILLLSTAAIVVALFGSKEIFDSVLFGWTGMGAAFGPILVHRLFLGPLPRRAILATMAIGFGTAVVGQQLASPDLQGVDKRLAPFILSTAAMFALRGKAASAS